MSWRGRESSTPTSSQLSFSPVHLSNQLCKLCSLSPSFLLVQRSCMIVSTTASFWIQDLQWKEGGGGEREHRRHLFPAHFQHLADRSSDIAFTTTVSHVAEGTCRGHLHHCSIPLHQKQPLLMANPCPSREVLAVNMLTEGESRGMTSTVCCCSFIIQRASSGVLWTNCSSGAVEVLHQFWLLCLAVSLRTQKWQLWIKQCLYIHFSREIGCLLKDVLGLVST